jgi:hypothetical protein
MTQVEALSSNPSTASPPRKKKEQEKERRKERKEGRKERRKEGRKEGRKEFKWFTGSCAHYTVDHMWPWSGPAVFLTIALSSWIVLGHLLAGCFFVLVLGQGLAM